MTRSHEDELERHLSRVSLRLRRDVVALHVDVALHLDVDEGEVVRVAEGVLAILLGA